MGESNQAGSVEYRYFLYTDGEPSHWYVARMAKGGCSASHHDAFYINEGTWVCTLSAYVEMNPLKRELCPLMSHKEISEEEAIKCIIGSWDYCKQLQDKLNGIT